MKTILTLLTSMAIALPAFAHDVVKGPNGGRVADAGNYHVELVAKEASINVYLTDANDKPVSPQGFKGTAILVDSGKSVRITLEPSSVALTGKAAAVLPGSPAGAVLITDPKGKTAQAKF